MSCIDEEKKLGYFKNLYPLNSLITMIVLFVINLVMVRLGQEHLPVLIEGWTNFIKYNNCANKTFIIEPEMVYNKMFL